MIGYLPGSPPPPPPRLCAPRPSDSGPATGRSEDCASRPGPLHVAMRGGDPPLWRSADAPKLIGQFCVDRVSAVSGHVVVAERGVCATRRIELEGGLRAPAALIRSWRAGLSPQKPAAAWLRRRVESQSDRRAHPYLILTVRAPGRSCGCECHASHTICVAYFVFGTLPLCIWALALT